MRRGRRGFTILEMLGALIMFTMVAAIGGRLVWQSTLAIHAERRLLAERDMRVSLLKQLRADALHATALRAVDKGVSLRKGDDEVVYKVTETGAARGDGANEIQWYLPTLKRLALDGDAAIRIEFDKSDPLAILAPWAAAKKGISP